MSIKRKLKRNREVLNLKKRRKELLELLEMSRTEYNKLNVRVTGEGLDYKDVVANMKGHKPSLKSQYSLLWDTYQDKLKDNKLIEEIRQKVEESKTKKENENENA